MTAETVDKKPSDCKFWDKGMCTHEDAPPGDKRCIGMGEVTGGCVAWKDDITHKAQQ